MRTKLPFDTKVTRCEDPCITVDATSFLRELARSDSLGPSALPVAVGSVLVSRKIVGKEMGAIKRTYVVLAALAGVVIATLLLPSKIVDFEENLPRAYKYVTSIVYKSDNWMGIFDKYPEGLVDMASLGISTNVDAALELEVVEGNRLDGRIWWQGSCALGGLYPGLLLDGKIKVGGSSAEVVIWELVGGHRVDIARGLLEIDGIMIRFRDFPASLGLNESKIAKNPQPALLDDWPDLYCGWFDAGRETTR